jgi:carbamoyl-phosphate synthase large subunit
MAKLVGVDTSLGPEMKSTGEVMGIDRTFHPALAKALMASNAMLPRGGALLLSISDRAKAESMPLIRRLAALGFTFWATGGTAEMITSLSLPVQIASKVGETTGPSVLEVINGGRVVGVVNTVTGGRQVLQDGFEIRRAAVERGMPCFTSIDTVRAAIESLEGGADAYDIRPFPEYLAETLAT